MIKKILVMLLTLLCFCSVSFAANWQWLISSDTTTISINTDNITRVNGVYTVWIKAVPVEYAQEIEDGKKIAMMMEQLNFRRTESGDECRSLQILCYDAKGNFVNSHKDMTNWSSVIPGTNGEKIFNKVLELRADADKDDDANAAAKAKKEKQAKRDKEAADTAKDIGKAVLSGRWF